VQAQQPLARVVVGGMITAPFAILYLIPVLASYWLSPKDQTLAATSEPESSAE
jgi:Cu/Ag efflux pump CusA